MVSVLDSVVDRGHIKFGICCLSTKHAGLMSKRNNWYDMSELCDMSISGDCCFSELAL